MHSCNNTPRKPIHFPFSTLSAEDRAQKPNCESPFKMFYPCCGYFFISLCGATKDWKCLSCATQSKRDKSTSMRSGLLKSPMGWVEMTLTAPGADVLGWDNSYCNHVSTMKCSGKIGCRVNEIEGALFNSAMPANWNRFMQDVRRAFKTDIQYAKVFEAQERDLLHIHGLATGFPAWPEKRIKRTISTLAKKHGFGRQLVVKRVMGDSPMDRVRAVGYVAKYLTKGSKTLKTISSKTGELRTGGYRDFTQSRNFGDTLKEVKSKRLLYWQSAQTIEDAGLSSESSAEQIAEGNQRGDEIALDNYKKSYTLIT
jgi:hypothetical protein